MDDLDAAHYSVRKLEKLDIIMVYPGHGDPFSMDELILGADCKVCGQ